MKEVPVRNRIPFVEVAGCYFTSAFQYGSSCAVPRNVQYQRQLHFAQEIATFRLGLYRHSHLSLYVTATSFPIFCLFNHDTNRKKYKAEFDPKIFMPWRKWKVNILALSPLHIYFGDNLWHGDLKVHSHIFFYLAIAFYSVDFWNKDCLPFLCSL